MLQSPLDERIEKDPPGGGSGRVAGIVLAAGRSRRMGRPKQLLPLNGATLIECVVTRIRPHVDSLVVVIGHEAAKVAAALDPRGIRLAVNDDVDRGMIGSVKCGLRAAGPGWKGFLFCLGDQPGLTDPVLKTVLAGASSSGKGIVIPTFSGKRGHPVYLSSRYYDRILGLDESLGLNAVTGTHPADTLEVAVAEAAVLEDMDTPEDYARLLGREAC